MGRSQYFMNERAFDTANKKQFPNARGKLNPLVGGTKGAFFVIYDSLPLTPCFSWVFSELAGRLNRFSGFPNEQTAKAVLLFRPFISPS
jgi:hypothetical protein